MDWIGDTQAGCEKGGVESEKEKVESLK